MSILNRRAKFDYEIKETYIAGLVLESNEVKPLRQGKASIQSSFINEQKGEIFINNLDIKRVSLFVLGPYRKSLDKQDSLKYFQSIEDFISEVYAKRLLSYPSGKIQIIKNEDKGKRGNIVYSLVKFNDRPKPISIDWWVIKNKVGVNKVFDMRISGIWMAQEQRSTFTSFLSKNNGDINKLINRLNSESR